jgi:hypothetical protein
MLWRVRSCKRQAYSGARKFLNLAFPGRQADVRPATDLLAYEPEIAVGTERFTANTVKHVRMSDFEAHTILSFKNSGPAHRGS